jgi:hypothetical protein
MEGGGQFRAPATLSRANFPWMDGWAGLYDVKHRNSACSYREPNLGYRDRSSSPYLLGYPISHVKLILAWCQYSQNRYYRQEKLLARS